MLAVHFMPSPFGHTMRCSYGLAAARRWSRLACRLKRKTLDSPCKNLLARYDLMQCRAYSSILSANRSSVRAHLGMVPIFTKVPSPAGRRSIFIQTENTPNPSALKFLPNHPILPEGLASPFIEYMTLRSTIAPPYPSPLAQSLMSVDGVMAVFYGLDFITVTKAADANWAHIKPEVFSLITEAVTNGRTIVSDVSRNSAQSEQACTADSLSYDENDSDVVGMIKELLETRIRPAIQEDGGDIEFHGFEKGMVKLKLRGACRTCDSSTVTLKNGIEGMLMHYIEEVKGVDQVLDPAEEIAIQEFAKFEQKLSKQKQKPTHD